MVRREFTCAAALGAIGVLALGAAYLSGESIFVVPAGFAFGGALVLTTVGVVDRT